MPGIQLSGLASGLDTASIITQLMSVEKAPRVQITYKQAAAQAREAGLKDVSTKLQALKDATDALKSVTTWNPVQSIDSADTSKATARQLSGAGPGSYTLAVTQLASSEQRTYAYTAPSGSVADTLTIGGVPVDIPADSSTDDVVAAINANSDVGVFAVNVSGSLVLASKTTGTAGDFAASSANGVLTEDPTKERAAKNAQFSIDGIAQPDSSTNVVANAIPGVELTLKGATAGTTITVGNPGVDKGAITSAVTNFVNAYNGAMDLMRSATSEKPVSRPAGTSDAAKGALYADPTLQGVMDSLRSTLGSSFTGVGNTSSFNLLSQIGISTGATTGSATFSADSVAGKLTLDTKVLSDALDKDPASVQRLLGAASSSTDGLSQKIGTALTPYTQTDGIIDQRVTSSDSDLRDIAQQLTDFDARIALRQTFLEKQFTSLETALQSLQAQSTSLASSLSGLSSSSG